jgi:sugar lactone lactonase YvrE
MTDTQGTRTADAVRIVKDGLVLGESPRWHAGRLWVADWGAKEILAIDESGAAEVVLRAPELPVCFDWLPDGRLLLVAGREGRLLRREPDGELVTHADLTALAPPPWNDIVVDGRGNAYVGGTGFDFPGGTFAPGTIAVVGPDGGGRQVADGVAFPNGVALTPDGATLIIAESYAKRLTAFDIAPDGGLSGRRVWADLGDGAPDGICLDAEGAVWYADVPNQRCVRVGEGGEVLQTVAVDRGCFACMLGGADGRTLYIVAARWAGPTNIAGERGTGRVLAVTAPAPHAGRP